MNDFSKARKGVLITGASYGVGQATALAFAREGYDVAITATRAGNLDETCAKLKNTAAEVVPLVLDLGSQASIDAAVDAAVAQLGRLDVLVNNASAHGRHAAVEITREEWGGIIDPNVNGTFFLTQRFARHLIADERGGSVICITSTNALRGAPGRLGYGVSKAAVNHMARMLAVEWAPHGIRVNAIAPGRMMTESPGRQSTAADPQYMETMLKRIPLRRMATADEVAETTLFLASDAAASITGQILAVDGGLMAQ
jgi:NAD(P)-dependent dehydrogenase (short-subunit alcohol dehydrogenase family)